MHPALPKRLLLASASTLLAAALTGCGMGNLTGATATSTAALTGIHGVAHGGQQPIVGAVINLYAPGHTGYGSAPSLLATTVTGVGGNYTLPAFTCPTPATGLVYMTATGGDAGSGVNALLAEAVVLGPCNTLLPSTFVVVSEVTTIAAAYTLAPFAAVSAAGTNIGTSATNTIGLNNAFGAASNLASNVSGYANPATSIAGLILPTSEINTLANILASCVNSNGALTVGLTTAPSSCGTLLTNITVASVAPINTFQAALNIALHPAANVTALYNLQTPAQVFAPTLASAPADFTLAIGYNGGALASGSGAAGVAIDATGNAWVATGGLSTSVHSLTEISPAGVYLSGSAVAVNTGFGFSNLIRPIGIAIDQNGLIDVAENAASDVVRFNPSGTYNSTFSGGSMAGSYPNSLSVDAAGDVWVANFNNTTNLTTAFTSAGAEAPHSPYTTAYGSVDVAAGPLAVWQSYYSSYYATRIDLTTSAVSSFYIGGPSGGIAVDHNNNAWIAVSGNGNVFEINNAGTFVSPYGGYVTGGNAQSITIDGLGNVWAGGYNATSAAPTTPGTLIEFNNAGTLVSPAGGYIASNTIPVAPAPPDGIHIDGSGNIWIAGTFNGSTNHSALSEVIGIAAPVVTPRSVAITNNTLGTRP